MRPWCAPPCPSTSAPASPQMLTCWTTVDISKERNWSSIHQADGQDGESYGDTSPPYDPN